MKKLARKLSVFALSSVMLLSNPPIKAGMFAEGQTYNLGAVGKITIDFHQELCDDREYFEFVTDNNKVCVEVGTDDYEVTVYNSAKEQLLHKYDKYEKKTETITQTLVLDILATTLTELAGSDKNQKLTDKLSPTQQSTKKPKRTTQDSLKSKKLAKPEDSTEETSEKSCIAQRTRRQTKLRNENTSEIISPEGQTDPSSQMPRRITRSLSSSKKSPAHADDDQNEISEKRKVRETCTVSEKTKTKKTDKHVEEKKPQKANQPVYRKITYALPHGYHYNYQTSHCACKHTDNSTKQRAGFTVEIGGNEVSLSFFNCLNCQKPIRRSRENNKNCCWKTKCPGCNCETEFYTKRGTGEKYVLICCNRYPFEIHQLEYANTAEFNAAVDSEDIAYICSKNPNHTRGRVYDGEYRVTTCLDCRKAYYYRKCTEYNSTS